MGDIFGAIGGLGTAVAAAVPAGLLLLKGAALIGYVIGSNSNKGGYGYGGYDSYSHGYDSYSSGYHRRKRSAVQDKEETAFELVIDMEPEECYHRLICDLGTGQLPAGQYDVIAELFNRPYGPQTAGRNYEEAYRMGQVVKSIRACELRYKCELTGEQMNQGF